MLFLRTMDLVLHVHRKLLYQLFSKSREPKGHLGRCRYMSRRQAPKPEGNNTDLQAALETVEADLRERESEALALATILQGRGYTRSEWMGAHYRHKDLAAALKVIRSLRA